MDLEYPHCSSATNSLNMDEDSDSSTFVVKSPILTGGLPGIESLNSDSEDDLPSYGFNLTPNIKKVQKVEFNAEEARAKRRKDEQFFARMEKLDALLKEDIGPNISTTTNSKDDDVEIENEDAKFILEKAKEMEVEEFTVKNVSQYVIIKPELSLQIFNHETLIIDQFLSVSSLEKKPQLLSCTFDNMDHSSFDLPLWGVEDQEGICVFLFLIMSVHPNFDSVNFCYSVLINESYFCPCLTDFINVFRNWGCDVQNLYETLPNIYTGLPSCFAHKRPDVKMEVKEHNMTFVFLYLTFIARRQPPDTFYYLIEPLLRLFFDIRIYSNSLQLAVIDIILLLTGLNNSYKEVKPKGVSVRDIHIRNLSMIQQTEICTKIFYRTSFGFPLGFAILQQFLGCSKIVYCQQVNLQTVCKWLTEKKNIIVTSTYLEIYCYLEVVTMFLFRYELLTYKDQIQQVNYDTWHDLLHDWSLRIARNDQATDPILLKEKISKLKYQIRMKQVIQIRQQREISLQMPNDTS